MLGELELGEGANGEDELPLGPVGAPKTFVKVFVFVLVFVVNENGFESVAVPDPKELFIFEGVALAGGPVCSSIGGVANRTCLLLCSPPRDEPLPLVLVAVPFWPLCSRFAAFSSRAFSNGSVVAVALGGGVAK